jgi:predicted transcriptional regulator
VPGLAPLEAAIMIAIWDAGQPLTVRAALDRLDYSTNEGGDPAYTTVMTVMTILCRKGLLSRARDVPEGNTRAWWYQARVTREDHLAAVIRQALECAPDPLAVLGRALTPTGPPEGHRRR